MLKIRLQRTGKKHDPYYRVVVTPHTYRTKTGKPVEIIGNFDIQRGKVTFQVDRVKHWLSVGAQATPTVNNMLITEGLIVGEKQRTIKTFKKKAGKKK
jgi:small subunit ribosomal protein S16